MKHFRLLAAGGASLLAAVVAAATVVAPSGAAVSEVAAAAGVAGVSGAGLATPAVPVAPPDTIGFHGPGGILTDISAVSPGRSLTINLAAETGGLVLDSAVNGQVKLTLTAPPGVTVPSSFPASVSLAGGQAKTAVSFPSAGYWRIAASGPGGSKGWVTVDVGVTPDTAP